MKGMGLKFTPVVVRHLLGPLSVFGSMAGTSWTYSSHILSLTLTTYCECGT